MRWVLAALLMFAGAAPAAADEGHVDLGVIVEFDKVAYLPTEVVTMRVLVMNSGTATATGVVLHSSGDLSFAGWGALDPAGPGVVLAPGQQVAVVVTATPNDTGAGMTQVVEAVSVEPDQNPADNQGTAKGFVTAETCDLTLTLYGDANDDGVVDKGEPLAGVLVTVTGGLHQASVAARTGKDGDLHLPGIAGGEYTVGANLPNGWFLDPNDPIWLRAGQNDVTVRATYHDLSKLTASVTFDRNTYAVNDQVRERITLTNTGPVALTDLKANCGSYSGYGPENELYSAGWAELDPVGGPGATVQAGEIRVWEFTDVVVPRAWDYGFVLLRCTFAVPGMESGAFAEARATVPGGYGTFGSTLMTDNHPAENITLLMINKATGKVTGRTTSDSAGKLAFPSLPAELYELRPLGPWRWESPAMTVQVLAGEHREYPPLVLVPGPVQLDPEAHPVVAPAGVTPPLTLANTGVGVVDLTALGTLLLVAGAALLRTRRRNCV